MKKRILLVALTLCASSAVAADRFAEMDKDKNDKVTWEEFEAAMPQMRKSAFESIDTNKDNAITRAEWDTFRASHGAKGGMG
ncbi:MAG: calcium-binding protein, partial [Bilophila sp.]